MNVTELQPGMLNKVRDLARSDDRIPKREGLEGLLLLRQAWCEYDIAMYLADRYKVVSKTFYILVLVLEILIIAFTVLKEVAEVSNSSSEKCQLASALPATFTASPALLRLINETETSCQVDPWPPAVFERLSATTLGHIVFVLSLISSFILTIVGFLNPVERWRKLRSSACTLDSLTWAYRTRMGELVQHESQAQAPQQALCAALLH